MTDTPAQLRPPGPFSRFEFLVAGRYLRARRKERFVSVIALLTLVGVALGVATLITVMSVMNGFRSELLGKILGLNGHFVVENVKGPFTDYQDVVRRLEGVPGVTYAIDVEESWVTATEREGTVELSWALEPTVDCFEPDDHPEEATALALDQAVEAYLFAGYTSNDWPSYEDHHDHYLVDVSEAGTLTVILEPGLDMRPIVTRAVRNIAGPGLERKRRR